MELPGIFQSPIEELEGGYERDFQKCSDLAKLYDYVLFRDFFKVLERRWHTLRDFAMSEIVADEVSNKCKIASNEVERLLNTFYTAVGRHEEWMDPQSRLNKELEHKKAEVITAMNDQRRP